MVERGQYTLREIKSQPETWASTREVFLNHTESIKTFWDKQDFDSLIFTGCGSTYYLSQIAAWLYQTLLQIPCRAYPASEIVFMPDTVLAAGKKPLLVTVSRSGQTTETIEAARLFKDKTSQAVMTVTCHADSTLAQEADLMLAIPAAQEQSLAQTRSFSSMLLMLQAVGGLLADKTFDWNQLIKAGAHLINEYEPLAREIGENSSNERFFFLGTGLQYGLAAEAMLKMKEMSLSYSEAYHFLEFRHGPMSMVNEQSVVFGLVSESASRQETAVLQQMKEQGATVVSLSESHVNDTAADGSHLISFDSALPGWAQSVLYLPVLQLTAYYRAISRGVNPDQPANLKAFISLDNLTGN